MLIGIDSSPCSLSLTNRRTLRSTTKCHQNKLDLKIVFVQKSFFFNISSFSPNHADWNQRRLFSSNLPGMFVKFGVYYFPWILETKFVVSKKNMIKLFRRFMPPNTNSKLKAIGEQCSETEFKGWRKENFLSTIFCLMEALKSFQQNQKFISRMKAQNISYYGLYY